MQSAMLYLPEDDTGRNVYLPAGSTMRNVYLSEHRPRGRQRSRETPWQRRSGGPPRIWQIRPPGGGTRTGRRPIAIFERSGLPDWGTDRRGSATSTAAGSTLSAALGEWARPSHSNKPWKISSPQASAHRPSSGSPPTTGRPTSFAQ